MIHVRDFILGRYPIRGFLAWRDGDGDALFVDPGGWDDAILETVQEYGLTVRAIVLTHGHWDHTEGMAEAAAHLRAPVHVHEADAHLLSQPADVLLDGRETITCGATAWQVLPVPGHTRGSVAYAAEDVVFTGDTLFAGSIGGTGNGEDFARECRSIRARLFPLGDATRAYPAHGPATTIGIERRCNPFLR